MSPLARTMLALAGVVAILGALAPSDRERGAAIILILILGGLAIAFDITNR
ncbi:MAG TPA: hypothetical protein VF183_02175 [Acidimicrobiales bacterium]